MSLDTPCEAGDRGEGLPIGKRVLAEYRRFDKQVGQLLEKSPRPITCRRGCDYCCYYPLRVARWEVAALSEAYRSRGRRIRRQIDKSVKKLSLRVKRIEKTWEEFPESSEERLAFCEARIPCPLLINSECSLYEARPLNCRALFAVSAPENCRTGTREATLLKLDQQKDELVQSLVEQGLVDLMGERLLVFALEQSGRDAAERG